MKFTALVFALLLPAFVSSQTFAEETVGAPFSALSFDQALAQAGKEKKIVLVDFYTTWCGPCKMLDKTTWKDAAVIAALSEKTIALKIDAEKETALAEKYSVRAYPTIALIRPDGSLLDKIVGYLPADAFLAQFKDSVAGKTAFDQAKESLELAKSQEIEQQVQTRYDAAKKLARIGENEKALSEYLWLFDEGMPKVPAYMGVRLSFLLNDIAQLAQQYPAAKDALIKRRDAARISMLESASNVQAAADFVGLCNYLKDTNEAIAAFKALPKGDPRRARIGRMVTKELIKQGAYGDALDSYPDTAFSGYFLSMVQRAKNDLPAGAPPEMKVMMIRSVATTGAERIEALAGVDRLDDAKKLIAEVLALDNSESTRKILRDHLTRAKHAELLP